MTSKRVSDPSWSDEERRNVLLVFIERARDALRGPIFEYGDVVKDPNGGTPIKGQVSVNRKKLEEAKNSSGKGIALEYSLDFPRFDSEQYLIDVTRIRPFMLSEQDIFLPKVTSHMILLAKEQFVPHLKFLQKYIQTYLDFNKPFSPNFFYYYQSSTNLTDEISASSSKIALDYIYGLIVKADLDKYAFIRYLQEQDDSKIDFALVCFIQQLMRLVYAVQHELVAIDDHDGYRIKIQTNDASDVAHTL